MIDKPTDHELLLLAAKAAGAEYEVAANGGLELLTPIGGTTGYWSPLDDDGDALRLAVKLDISTRRYGNLIEVVAPNGNGYGRVLDEFCGDDRNAATRRAIVRAAAEIGRMQEAA